MFRLFRGKREALKKYLLAAFLLIMALGMIGVVTPFFSGGDTSRVEMNVLAEVGDHTITVQDLQRTVQSRLKNTPQGFDSRLVPLLAACGYRFLRPNSRAAAEDYLGVALARAVPVRSDVFRLR